MTYIGDGRLSLTLSPLTMDLPVWCFPTLGDIGYDLITLGPLAMDLTIRCFPAFSELLATLLSGSDLDLALDNELLHEH